MRGQAFPAALVALAAVAAGCGADDRCRGDEQCQAPEQACRLEVQRCQGWSDVATLAPGHCRDRGAQCSGDDDCVPAETCQLGTCKPDRGLCSGPPHTCPPDCTWTAPFPCACVCAVCPVP